MRTYIIKEYPKCKYCHEKMDHVIIGLSYDEHSHAKCAAEAMVQQALQEAFNGTSNDL